MFDAIIEHLQPDHAKHLLVAITDLSDINYKATDTSISYIKMVYDIGECFEGVDIIQLVPLFAIANLDQDKYPGLMSRHLADDPTLIHANLLSLGQMMAAKEKPHGFLNLKNGLSSQLSSAQ